MSVSSHWPLDAGRLEEALPEPGPIHSVPVDLEALNEVTGGDVEFAADLVASYISSSQQLLTKILHCFARGDRYQLARAVHQLAGASANVYATRLRELCFDLERAAKTVTLARLEQHITQVAAELTRVIDVLANRVDDRTGIGAHARGT
jgi:HPt (histidine-containing phosphotransfer) domain-containing protein